jgi:two-component system NarL family sensor kinase
LPKIEGTSLWEFKDAAGHYIIQYLIEHARSGDHFWNYVWHRPTTGKIEPKLGYVEYVPECNLMIGTGLYLDYMKEVSALIDKQTKDAIGRTRERILLIALASLLVVAAGGLTLKPCAPMWW